MTDEDLEKLLQAVERLRWWYKFWGNVCAAAFYGIFVVPFVLGIYRGTGTALVGSLGCVVLWLLSAALSKAYYALIHETINRYEKTDKFVERLRNLSKSRKNYTTIPAEK
jgi:hypothetical protein